MSKTLLVFRVFLYAFFLKKSLTKVVKVSEKPNFIITRAYKLEISTDFTIIFTQGENGNSKL